MNIIYSCDQNYVRHAAASIESLLRNNSREKIVIYLINNKIEAHSLSKLIALVKKHGQKIKILNIEDVCAKVKKMTIFLFQVMLDFLYKILLKIKKHCI